MRNTSLFTTGTEKDLVVLSGRGTIEDQSRANRSGRVNEVHDRDMTFFCVCDEENRSRAKQTSRPICLNKGNSRLKISNSMPGVSCSTRKD